MDTLSDSDWVLLDEVDVVSVMEIESVSNLVCKVDFVSESVIETESDND